MPRRPTRTVPTVILPGWQGSGPGHWQTWLGEQLTAAGREVRNPDFADLDHPQLDDWLAALGASLDGLTDDGFDVVAHSLGSILWLQHAASSTTAPRPARVALVAPPSPVTHPDEVDGFFPVPLDVDAVRHAADGTVLVGGSDDPHCPEGIAEAYGRPLKMATTVIEGGGHLNVAAGYGEWPAVLDWCGRDNLAFF
ncbi:alpha/beta hydrolase [Jatrophihabitans endophyticus]|uniref:RBBP9/YdeN family alpha/beta hydrolase n=1 Tax=Jatrophihabitans endophyticus TaxID=1206085 RepID=UPI0019FF93EE|nr:alpha/beta hydrolase [Jatrophihabitans endophyticus]MBE7188040.1 alpha/beta hydrolase [Jatrophihabitans endophyticus]